MTIILRPVWEANSRRGCSSSCGAAGHGQRQAEAAEEEGGGLAGAVDEGGAGGEGRAGAGGGEDDQCVHGGVEGDAHQAEEGELEGGGGGRVDELGDEGEEECGRLRVCGLDDDPVAEGAAGTDGGCLDGGGRGLAEGADAEPDEVDGADELECGEEFGRGEDQGRDADGAGSHVDEAAQAGAEGGGEALPASAGEGPGGDVEDAGARREGDEEGGGGEGEEGHRSALVALAGFEDGRGAEHVLQAREVEHAVAEGGGGAVTPCPAPSLTRGYL